MCRTVMPTMADDSGETAKSALRFDSGSFEIVPTIRIERPSRQAPTGGDAAVCASGGMVRSGAAANLADECGTANPLGVKPPLSRRSTV